MADRGEEILGTILDGRYRVEAMLGAAHAGGSVFRGRDTAAGSTVVVRCPDVSAELHGEALDRAFEAFLAEAELLARVGQGSNDVERLLASGVAERSKNARVPYTVFEWLAGRSLERHIKERGGGGSISEALVILEPAARALSIAHAMGTAHRDVRPENLWLAELGGRTTLKVAAFGLAARVGDRDVAFAPEYGAPEQFNKSYGAVGPATDVYGLALCVIEMVTGKRALAGADAGELYVRTSDLSKRPTLRAQGSHVSDAVESVLQRALAVDPKRRWATAREFWDALVGAVPEMTPGPPSVRSAVKTSDRPPGALGTAPPAASHQDSGPTSVPPGLVHLARAALSPSAAVIAEDARLGDSVRGAASQRPLPNPQPSPDRSGTWAWISVGVLGLLAAGVVVAKIGGGPAASVSPAAGTGASASADANTGASADANTGADTDTDAGEADAADADEQAVRVRPFLGDMVRVPAGTFVMGSDHDGKGERPPHTVVLTHAYYIDRTEVRADAYSACAADGTCRPNSVHTGPLVESVWACNREKDRPAHPANCVDRVQAEAYCAWVRKRLPTEAEWEYAARGSDGREYPWGNAAPTKCTMAILTGMTGECGERKGTWEVGTTADGESAFGALDMAGNVWEWVADSYSAYPVPDGGASGAGDAPLVDPIVALSPTGRGVLRGGSWDYSVTSAKTTYRLPFATTSGNVSTGFRCARDAE